MTLDGGMGTIEKKLRVIKTVRRLQKTQVDAFLDKLFCTLRASDLDVGENRLVKAGSFAHVVKMGCLTSIAVRFFRRQI